jgi:AraC-like DNA-binding protein
MHAAAQSTDRVRHLIEFARCELSQPSAGGDGVLLRLAELMFIEVVRRHLETLSAAQPGWLAGLHEPLVARALALLHGEPARRWTLETLAAQAGASRSVLAERFTHYVGQPPMQYLAQWRMQLATLRLVEPGYKILAIAQAVGYESEAAFSRAFKKCLGVAPAVWRQRSAVGAAGRGCGD